MMYGYLDLWPLLTSKWHVFLQLSCWHLTRPVECCACRPTDGHIAQWSLWRTGQCGAQVATYIHGSEALSLSLAVQRDTVRLRCGCTARWNTYTHTMYRTNTSFVCRLDTQNEHISCWQLIENLLVDDKCARYQCDNTYTALASALSTRRIQA